MDVLRTYLLGEEREDPMITLLQMLDELRGSSTVAP
jgi:hypothetical protein